MISKYPDHDDLSLISLLRENDDEQAFAEIYRRYASELTGFATGRLFSLEDARDVIHDVFVKLWSGRKKLQIDHSLRGYLYTLARYAVVNKIRKNIHGETYAALIGALEKPDDSSIEQRIAAKELKREIQLILDKLPPRTREIYQLSRDEYLSVNEIAQKLNISEQTVKNQLTIALKHLRSSIPLLSLAALTQLLF